MPAEKVVTTASSNLEPPLAPVQPATPPTATVRPKVDFGFLHIHINI